MSLPGSDRLCPLFGRKSTCVLGNCAGASHYRRSASKLDFCRSYRYHEHCIYAPDSTDLNHTISRSQSRNLGSSDFAFSVNGRWMLFAWCDRITKVRVPSSRVLSLLERHTEIVSAARFSSWSTLRHLRIRRCDCDRRAM